MNLEANTTQLSEWRRAALQLEETVGRVIVGQAEVVRLLILAVFARGHVLLEGDVGVGKTTLLQALARGIGGAYGRIEGTVDLMPGDLLYNTYIGEDGRPRVEPGPVLAHGPAMSIFFFNEINRARPQVHSLLLRLMAERSVSAFGREHHFPHLLVFADRNQVEKEETFELPAAARDRFLMEIHVGTPQDRVQRRQLAFDPRFHDTACLVASLPEGVLDHRELGAIARVIQTSVQASEALQDYVVSLWQAVREPARAGIEIDGIDMTRLVAAGASPRGISYLVRAARVRAWLEGRDMLVPEDIRAVFPAVMSHRLFLDPIYEVRREQLVPRLIDGAFERVAAP